MTYSDLITKVKAVLVAGVTELQAIYDKYPDNGPTVYPCAIIMPTGRANEWKDMRDIRRKYTLSIRIYVNLENTEVNSQVVLRDVVDKVSNVLEKNITLDGTVDFAMPINDRFDFDPQNAKIYFNQITYTVNSSFNRTV